MSKKRIVTLLVGCISFLIVAYLAYSQFGFIGRCSNSDIETHRTQTRHWENNYLIDPPRLKYSDIDQLNDSKLYFLRLIIRKNGNVKCYRLHERETQNSPSKLLNPDEQILALKAIVKNLKSWKFPIDVANPRKEDAIIEVDIWPEIQIASIVPLPPNASENIELHYFSGGCYGICPSFGVVIKANGQVEFEGREYVREIGKKNFRITTEKVAELFDYFEQNHIWSLDGEYGAVPIDAGTAGLQIAIDGEEHWITHPYKARGHVPYPVVKLESMIESIPQISELIGPRSEFSDYD